MSEHHYEGKLEELSERLFEGIEYANKKYGTQHGFIGLMTRDPSLGNIDIIHNYKDENDLIRILQLTIDQLKKNPKENNHVKCKSKNNGD